MSEIQHSTQSVNTCKSSRSHRGGDFHTVRTRLLLPACLLIHSGVSVIKGKLHRRSAADAENRQLFLLQLVTQDLSNTIKTVVHFSSKRPLSVHTIMFTPADILENIFLSISTSKCSALVRAPKWKVEKNGSVFSCDLFKGSVLCFSPAFFFF